MAVGAVGDGGDVLGGRASVEWHMQEAAENMELQHCCYTQSTSDVANAVGSTVETYKME